MLEVLHVYDEGEIHAVLAKVSDLFGIEGGRLLDRLLDRTSAQALPAPYAARVGSLRRIMDQLDFEIDTFARLARGRLAGDEAFVAV